MKIATIFNRLLVSTLVLSLALSFAGCPAKKPSSTNAALDQTVIAAQQYNLYPDSANLEILINKFNELKNTPGGLDDLAAYRKDGSDNICANNTFGELLASSKVVDRLVKEILKDYFSAAKDQIRCSNSLVLQSNRPAGEGDSDRNKFFATSLSIAPEIVNDFEKNGVFKEKDVLKILQNMPDEKDKLAVINAMNSNNKKKVLQEEKKNPKTYGNVIANLASKLSKADRNLRDSIVQQQGQARVIQPPPPPPVRRYPFGAYDQYGMDPQGLDEKGFNIAGYNNAGLDKNGQHFSGHLPLNAQGRLFDNITGINQIMDLAANIPVQFDYTEDPFAIALNQVSRGLDQMGFSRRLTHGSVAQDESFDRNGFNSSMANTEKNYLGLTKAQFDAKGTDAVLDSLAVLAYPNDIDALVQRFNNSCFELKYVDLVMGDEDWGVVNDAAGNPIGGLLGFAQKYYPPIMTNFQAFNNPPQSGIDEKHLPMTKAIKDNHNNLRPIADVEQIFIKHLKKGIHFCENFLFAGDLTIANSTVFNARIVNTGNMLTDQVPTADYKNYLSILQRPHEHSPSLDFIGVIKSALTDSILKEATYTEAVDRGNYGTYAANGVNPPSRFLPASQRNMGVQRMHIDKNLDVYADNYDPVLGKGKDYDLSRVYLRLIADKINDDAHIIRRQFQLYGAGGNPNDFRTDIAGRLAHAGAHCLDARRKTLLDIALLIDPDGVAKVGKLPGLVLGKDNLALVIKSILAPLKAKKFTNMIETTFINRPAAGDQFSGFAGTWNKYRRGLGLPAVEMAHDMPIVLTIANFYNHNEGAIPVPPANNWTANGGYSKQNILYFVAQHMDSLPSAAKPSDQLQSIRNEIFGPLWFLIEDSAGNDIGGGRMLINHPILIPLLVRLGIFN